MAGKDIAGRKFGRLLAKSFQYYNEKHQECWLFQCDCGNEKIIPAASVKCGHTQSCGCLRRERSANLNKQDITGQRFGRLTAVRPTEERDTAGSIIWECQCDCGGTGRYSVNVLRKGMVRSCGCLYKESRPSCSSYRRDVVENTRIGTLVFSKELRSNNTSGHTGVYQEKNHGQWVAYINFQKRRYFLGSFSDKKRAIEARKEAEQRLHDPIIEEYWNNLTEESRKRFQDYLNGSISNIPGNA